MSTSPLGLWNATYASRPQQPYDDPRSYRIGAEFLHDCRSIEDWGCGYGWFGRTFADYSAAQVRGLDGSQSPFADEIIDLRERHSAPEGIFLRGVLEHNHEWPRILRNALESFTRKMVLVCFTPFGPTSRKLYDASMAGGGRVPVFSLSHRELTAVLQSTPGILCRVERRVTQTEYGAEHFFFLEKLSPTPLAESLTIHCVTTGRATLAAALESIRRETPGPSDEVLLVEDAPISDGVRSAWEAASLPGALLGLPGGPHGDFGETPRNATLPFVRGRYVLNLDDDDELAPGALNAVREAIAAHPDAFLFFQVELPDGSRYWDVPELRWGKIGGSMFVAPTDVAWGRRGNFEGGDYYFILETLARNPERPVVWINRPVVRIRPHTRTLP